MDDLLAAVPGAADDALTEDILAALPPTAFAAACQRCVKANHRAPAHVTPIQRHTDPLAPSVGLAPVVMEPTTPTCGRPAPARLRVGGLNLEGPLTGR
ncbi:MAG: hypothetical protein IPO15_25895 [Anaerolineae bacterium]|uniref:hypothetical protein n=1 Tax=Candidatus Amarolinea dominans TaxID=3140696 RepID=UPI003136CCF7|nr:hypothetical protein [Anaerolineae bacterium]